MCEHKPLWLCAESGDLVGQTEGLLLVGGRLLYLGICCNGNPAIWVL